MSLAAAGPALAQGDAALAAKINAGYDLLEQGKYAEARKVYEEVLQKQPDHPLALNKIWRPFPANRGNTTKPWPC